MKRLVTIIAIIGIVAAVWTASEATPKQRADYEESIKEWSR